MLSIKQCKEMMTHMLNVSTYIARSQLVCLLAFGCMNDINNFELS